MRQAGRRANLELCAPIQVQCWLTVSCSETRPNAKPENVGGKCNQTQMIDEIWINFVSETTHELTLNSRLIVTPTTELHHDLLAILAINNGQNFNKEGIFVRPKANILSSPSWTRYKYLDYDSISKILKQISEEQRCETPFAISGNFEDIGECLTINSLDGKISLVSFGLIPPNYDERDVLRYVKSKDLFSYSMRDFLNTQTTLQKIA